VSLAMLVIGLGFCHCQCNALRQALGDFLTRAEQARIGQEEQRPVEAALTTVVYQGLACAREAYPKCGIFTRDSGSSVSL